MQHLGITRYLVSRDTGISSVSRDSSLAAHSRIRGHTCVTGKACTERCQGRHQVRYGQRSLPTLTQCRIAMLKFDGITRGQLLVVESCISCARCRHAWFVVCCVLFVVCTIDARIDFALRLCDAIASTKCDTCAMQARSRRDAVAVSALCGCDPGAMRVRWA